mgnify:CR=1 FL=1
MQDRPSKPADAITLPHREPPGPGAAIAVAPGILWARMPLPLRLNHVNVWLIEEGDGWIAVDCGLDTPETRAAWDKLAAGPLGGRPVRRLVATHGHVDHIGLAGYVTGRFAATYHATRAAWLWGRVGHLNAGQPTSAAALAFLKSHGVAAAHVAAYAKDRGVTSRLFGPQPTALHRIEDGDTIAMGGHAWRTIVANGHADDHASFVSEPAGVLIAGDQVLQKISPVVGVFATEPLADPLSAYLASLPRFTALDPDQLVLPSHGLPFRGLRPRVAELARHHEMRLDKARAGLDRPRSAVEASSALFDASLVESQWLLTLAETLAHLHRLVTLGEVRREVDANGRISFARA